MTLFQAGLCGPYHFDVYDIGMYGYSRAGAVRRRDFVNLRSRYVTGKLKELEDIERNLTLNPRVGLGPTWLPIILSFTHDSVFILLYCAVTFHLNTVKHRRDITNFVRYVNEATRALLYEAKSVDFATVPQSKGHIFSVR